MATTVIGTTTYNGHTYHIITSDELGSTAAERWENAKTHCANLGGHLAIIDNANENAALFNYIQSLGINNAYFGLSDAASEGTWTWVDGTPLTYSNWGTGASNGDEPNGYTYENYGMFYGGSYTNGEWNDGDFVGSFTVHESTVSFICEVDGVIEQPIGGDTSSIIGGDTSSIIGGDTSSIIGGDDTVTPETLPPAISNTAYDIVFILDVSGSMSTYINRVNEIAQTFVDKLAERGITDYRLAVVDYETNPTVYFGADGSPFTTDVNLFKTWLSQASAKSTAGLPNENGLYAINYILDTFTFNPAANKEFIVLTDEDFYDGITADLSATEQLLATNDVQLDVIGQKGSTCESAWTPVARHTGGNFYDINGNYEDTIIEIVRDFDCVNVDLSTVPDGQTGYFLLVPGYNLNGNSVDAVFVAANNPDPNLAVYAQTLPVVGTVTADKVYNGTVSSYRQNVTIPDLWNVTATSHADILNVAGTGFGVVIASGDGHDAVKLGESVTGIILTDHDLTNDGLEFARRQTLGTFTESVETNPVTLMNQVTLASPTMAIYLQNFSSPLLEEFEAKNTQFMSYGVTNRNRSDTVYDLLFSEDYVGNGNGRIQFAQWGYGFTPPEWFTGNATLATSADLAEDFGSPTLDEISPANFAVTENAMPDQNLTAFTPKVAEMILSASKPKF